ncbi:MAG: NAD(P)H-dependent oxidoreductase [Spirochaetes bacterium]|nr:NAD(P)H-dependent oxidoreductase [Spirochaetota bacterium]
MNVSILLAHPNPGSFNHALAAAVVAAAETEGHRARLNDLYAEGFDPVFTANELSNKNPALPPEIARHEGEILEADGLVFIHPNWWGQPPAILKGWLDRVLRAGTAYRFGPDAKGIPGPIGLLKARFMLVLNTSNTPDDVETARYGDPLEGLWRKAIAGFLGIPSFDRINFGPIITSTPKDRENWLTAAGDAAKKIMIRASGPPLAPRQ